MFGLILSDGVNAFPRSVLEIFRENAEYSDKLRIEPQFVLYYPTALYYYFSHKNEKLANDVEHGLQLLYESGEFQAFFMQEFGEAIKRACLADRQIIELKNPDFPIHPDASNHSMLFTPSDLTPQYGCGEQ